MEISLVLIMVVSEFECLMYFENKKKYVILKISKNIYCI